MSTLYVPPTTESDARNRALRSFAWGLLIDVVAAVLLAVAPSIAGSDFAWSAAYWQTLGLLAAKTAVQALVSYLMRKLLPPPT